MFLHQIWVGNSKIPTIFEENPKKIELLNKNLEYKFWDNDKSISEFPELKKYFDIKCPPVYISNILRLKILHKYGGWYVDINFTPLKPLSNILINPNIYDIVLSTYHKNPKYYNTNLLYVNKNFTFDFNYCPDIPLFSIFNKYINNSNLNVYKIPLDNVGINGDILVPNSTLSARNHKYYNYFLDNDYKWVHKNNKKS